MQSEGVVCSFALIIERMNYEKDNRSYDDAVCAAVSDRV